MRLKFTCGNVKMFLSVSAPTHSIHFLLRGDLECLSLGWDSPNIV